MKLSGYYAIVDVPVRPGDAGSHAIDDHSLQEIVRRAGRLLAASPCMLQLRGKTLRAADLATLARAVLPLARAAGVPLCVNDRLDVALVTGADAVHLGQDDLPIADARRVAGQRLLIGVSTHDPAQARAAMAAGADYIGFGPVFPTTTKGRPHPTVGVEGVRRIAAGATVPVVAIGGIALDRVHEVAAAGASAAALIAAIDGAPDPAAAGQAVNAAFRRS